MSTVAFPGVYRPEPVTRNAVSVVTLSPGNPEPKHADLTIHRISRSHHGRTLLTLGHAAEYLANSRRYSIQAFDNQSDDEAIHILMGLSKGVFEDLARPPRLIRRIGDWAIERVVRLLDQGVRRARA
ncbi:hypothetical protein [Granulicella sp. S190]|uniref:hypothetical protein n=1 Tax=Granulicella sp. S190 TaxID=1747226 RepID=UPI00131EBDEE|nr:hypothetical protein [Granulicella sp. S190]